MDKVKSVWQVPRLITILRTKKEEAVLTACKGNGNETNPTFSYGPCVDQSFLSCGTCAAVATS
jgi:hypothetical protein